VKVARSSLLESPVVRLALCAMAALAMTLVFSARASASPGAYRVLIAEAYPQLAKELAAQVSAFPDVATVDLVNTGEEGRTPTAAELSSYDVVVSIGDSTYLDPEAWGNSLAGYIDSGGVVVSTTYDTWDGGGAPLGRYAAGGYAPFIVGPNVNKARTLGNFDASSPLMQNIGPASLTTTDNTTNELAPGATLVASWNDGQPAVAFKGRVVGITAYIGDHYGEVWTGNYGPIIVNAVRTFGHQRLTVVNSNPVGGTITGSAGGISCGAVCSADFVYQTPVSLTAAAKKGFAFAGFSGACTGAACALTMDAPKSVTANFAAFGFGKVKLNKKKGTAKLTVKVGAPGKLVVSGKKIKKRSKATKSAGNVTISILPKGKAAKALKETGRAKVKVKLAYTPSGGTTATQSKSIQLKLDR
jgi:List-Bact-rpt repeat protein